MEQSIKNQMVYLCAWNWLKKICSENKMDIKFAEKVNKKNAETLMCDLLPIQ